MFHLENNQIFFKKCVILTHLQNEEESGSSDEDYWLASTHNRHKKIKGILENEEEPEEEIEPDMETLSAVIKLEVGNCYYMCMCTVFIMLLLFPIPGNHFSVSWIPFICTTLYLWPSR